ncbi:uncharacterized protein N7483_007963 [Penicillium malachiteum]|uniref:uncharacterized protein n=1 Tax=Penicillium malachiteum TaxID=1324776 RepID=UPI002548E16A|nr:uncharacterized protein N7483_007963 [Penicillium malachiteum]KAJ5726606.1 hypothetical protein N7483_007963 [Penicillium malachiteum]
MIDPEDRFVSLMESYFGDPKIPTTQCFCNVWDWDQLRMIKIKGTARIFPPEEDKQLDIVAQFADYLSLDVCAISVDDNGLLTGPSTDPEEDDTRHVGHIPFSLCDSIANCPKMKLSEIQSLDRLGAGVDLVLIPSEGKKVAFKFNPLKLPPRLEMAWKEVNILSKLPQHPNIVPFDRIVLEDVESRVIGFTTKYIPCQPLSTTSGRPFRLEWLQQLTQLVDFLNLDLGIMHQDIAPRNLLIDPETDKILLFDFDWAVNGKNGLEEGRDDIITKDTHFTKIPHWARSIDIVQNIEWECHCELDHDVSIFREFLNEWIATRSDKETNMERFLNAPNRLTWPSYPTPPEYGVPDELGTKSDGTPSWITGTRSRRAALKLGQYSFRWERPPQSRLLKMASNIKSDS